jgi:hypothetical protein
MNDVSRSGEAAGSQKEQNARMKAAFSSPQPPLTMVRKAFASLRDFAS